VFKLSEVEALFCQLIRVEKSLASCRQAGNDRVVTAPIFMEVLLYHGGRAYSLCCLPHSAVSGLIIWPLTLSF
jgi:hypothetical protein